MFIFRARLSARLSHTFRFLAAQQLYMLSCFLFIFLSVCQFVPSCPNTNSQVKIRIHKLKVLRNSCTVPYLFCHLRAAAAVCLLQPSSVKQCTAVSSMSSMSSRPALLKVRTWEVSLISGELTLTNHWPGTNVHNKRSAWEVSTKHKSFCCIFFRACSNPFPCKLLQRLILLL